VKRARTIILPLIAVAIFGCSDKTDAPTTGTTGAVTGGTTGSQAAATVPDTLKHDAYIYQGLGNEELLTYDVTFNEMPKEDGTQQNKLEKVENGVATYKVSRTGGLARLGVDTIEVTDKEVRMVGSSMGVLTEPSVLMPANPTVGTAWDTRLDMDNVQGDRSVKSSIKHKVTKTESVTVPAGTYDCLVVESTLVTDSSSTAAPGQSTKKTVTMTSHYAQGIGIVKLQIKEEGKTVGLVELKSTGSGKPAANSSSAPGRN
jgi:hypothetical protein